MLKRSDGAAAYRSLSGLGDDQPRMVMLGSGVADQASMTGAHRLSLVKRRIPGTHHGSVQPGHLDA